MNYDKYCYTEECIKKLVRTYFTRGYLIIAFDFDDTILSSEPDYECYTPALLVNRCKHDIKSQLILYTCRSSNRGDGANLKYAIEVCKRLDIEPDFVNQHAWEDYRGLNGKVFYDIFLDDKAGLGQACEILEEALNRILNELEKEIDN